jgi:hypothetical protein
VPPTGSPPYGFRFAHGFATASRPSRRLTQKTYCPIANLSHHQLIIINYQLSMKTFFSIVGLLLCTALLFGQPYPVTCNVNVLPPSSTYLPDYAGVGNEKLQVLLQLRDPSTPTLGVGAVWKIE